MFMTSIRSKLHATTIGFLATTFAAVGFSGIANGQVVVSAPQTTPVDLFADDTVIVTSTGSISAVTPDTYAINANGNNSVIDLFGPVSVTSTLLGSSISTIVQEGDTYNTLNVHQGGNISATGIPFGVAFIGVLQRNASADNTVTLENALIRVESTSADTVGILQDTDSGTNTLQFGANGRISVLGASVATGIDQANSTGDINNLFGSGTQIDVEALLGDAAAIRQDVAISGDASNVFGANARITAKSTSDAFGIAQDVTSGVARTVFGSGAFIRIQAGAGGIGILQDSGDNRFGLGQNSVISVEAADFGLGLLQEPSDAGGRNQAILQAGSRINVTAGLVAFGILSDAAAPVTSSLTLEPGAQVSSTGAVAFGVLVDSDNFEMLNRGRIAATSTDVSPVSFGVLLDGDNNSFVNHGSVFADLAPDSHAILIDGDRNMLSLLTYPVIQGQITFNGSLFGADNTLLVGRGFDAAFTVGASPIGLTVLGQGQSLTVNQIGTNLLKVVSISSEGFFQSLKRAYDG